MEISDSTKATPCRNPTRSYAAVTTSGSPYIASHSKEYDQGFTLDTAAAVPLPKVSTMQENSEGFKTVTYKKKSTTDASMVNTVTCMGSVIPFCHIKYVTCPGFRDN
jgi:hypothetical protein